VVHEQGKVIVQANGHGREDSEHFLIEHSNNRLLLPLVHPLIPVHPVLRACQVSTLGTEQNPRRDARRARNLLDQNVEVSSRICCIRPEILHVHSLTANPTTLAMNESIDFIFDLSGNTLILTTNDIDFDFGNAGGDEPASLRIVLQRQ